MPKRPDKPWLAYLRVALVLVGLFLSLVGGTFMATTPESAQFFGLAVFVLFGVIVLAFVYLSHWQ